LIPANRICRRAAANCFKHSPILGERFPHWRFGQSIENIAGWADIDVWDIEDGGTPRGSKNAQGNVGQRNQEAGE
jgi:hypothetical protein